MPAQSANGSGDNNKSGNGESFLETRSQDKFLFTSESVGEGHPGN